MIFNLLKRKKVEIPALENQDKNKSYWSYVRRQFKKNKRAMFSMYILGFLMFMFVFADFIANNKPIVAKYEDKITFPVVREYLMHFGLTNWPAHQQGLNWKEADLDFAIWPLVPYSPKDQDINNIRVSPGSGDQEVASWFHQHWLGTDDLGRDLLAAMIHATRIDLSIGVVAMAVATLIGIILGSLAGFFGDTHLRMSRIRLGLNLLALFFAFFYAFSARSYVIADAINAGVGPMMGQFFISIGIFGAILVAANVLAFPLKRIGFLNKKVNLPMDIGVSRLIEVVVSIPTIFLIIMVLAIAEKGSIFWVMVVIGFTSWTGIARFIRAELLKVRSLEYIEAAQALGYSDMRMLFKHAIPNAMAPVFIAVAFGIASAILIEAFLAFIGIGVPPDVLTWGSLLNLGRETPTNWWMALFPGIAIFITVTIFNLIGEGLTDALDPRLKQ